MITLSVSQLNRYLRALCDGDASLQALFVCGEVSNFTRHRTGHLYFSLKDGDASVRCVMFARQAASLRFPVDDGIRVICGGRVSVYERDGSCQLYVERMTPDGEGAARLALEQLYEKLRLEGLFAPERKRPLPQFPKKVAVITSASGAARVDVEAVWKRKWPSAELILFPASVQGAGAVPEILEQLAKMSPDVADAVLLVRGGGSSEDLWVFNNERLVRAAADCPVPLISAVGHEVDYTLCDLAADARAATPTAAADLIFPDQAEIAARIGELREQCLLRTVRLLDLRKQQTESALERLKARSPQNRLILQQNLLAGDLRTLLHQMTIRLETERHRFLRAASALQTLSPAATLLRGYTYVSDGAETVTSAAQAITHPRLTIHFPDGTVRVRTERNSTDAERQV